MTQLTKRSIRHLAAAIIALSMVLLSGAESWAEAPDAVEGRLTLSASYGFLAAFYQDEEARGYNPAWGHGVFLRLGGESCGVICGGLSVLGNVNVMPKSSGSIGVGPHLGMRWDGPSWAGAYVFRAGAAYFWLMTPEPSFETGQLEFGDSQSGHGVGGWLEVGIELSQRSRFITPIIAARGRYVAVVTTDPIEHHLSAQIVLGFTIGRRLLFSEPEELDVPDEEVDETSEEGDEEEDERSFELDEHDEQRLREAEEELRE